MRETEKHGARIAALIAATLLALAIAGVLVNEWTSADERLDAGEARVAHLLVKHSQLRQFLENDLSRLSEPVAIATTLYVGDVQAILVSDGEFVIPGRYNSLSSYIAGHEQ